MPPPMAGMPPPMAKPHTGKGTAGGVLLLLGGIFGLIGGLSILALPAMCGGIGYMPFDLAALGVAVGLICTILPVITLVGGIMALKRRMWGLALVGGILGLFSTGFIFSLIGLILVAMSKNEF
jgi:hypothetical protein